MMYRKLYSAKHASLNERLILSALIKFGKLTKKKIWDKSGLTDKTVASLLQKLISRNLIIHQDRLYEVIITPENFNFTKKGYPSYMKMAIPNNECPLTTAQIAIFSLLKFWKPQASIKSIKRLLKLDIKTVRTASKILKSHGSLEDIENKSWWKIKEKAKLKVVKSPVIIQYAPAVNDHLLGLYGEEFWIIKILPMLKRWNWNEKDIAKLKKKVYDENHNDERRCAKLVLYQNILPMFTAEHLHNPDYNKLPSSANYCFYKLEI